MSRTALLSTLLLSLSSSAFAQEPPFTVARPGPDDTLNLSSSDGANELYVGWTVAPGTEDQAVLVTLQRGEELESLETIEVIDGTASNTGNYTWNGGNGVSLATACNYTVRLSVDGLVAYSQYFTIVNADDGPIPDRAKCPGEQGASRPQVDGNSAVLGSKDDASNGDNGGSDGGISTSTLAAAIVVPIVVLLAAFALLIWLGIRRGWFVKWSNRRAEGAQLTHENTAGLGDGGEGGNIAFLSAQYPGSPAAAPAEKRDPVGVSTAAAHDGAQEPQELHSKPAMAERRKPVGSSMAPAFSDQPQELHSESRPWEAEGREVHQLEGDERDARWGDGYMRGS